MKALPAEGAAGKFEFVGTAVLLTMRLWDLRKGTMEEGIYRVQSQQSTVAKIFNQL